ncbi:MAG TPA: ABC transporter ATP-binding protein [Chitinispirillaceae bacterium]|nr:ABC transporter ATP-binding protein [Chitinispirillaceae bacterium]
MTHDEIINCSNITKTYGDVDALRGVSISVNRGESVAIAGANGAGKSTLFNILLGLLKPEQGSSSIAGINSTEITCEIREIIGFIADHASPVPWASPHDLAKLYSKIYSNWDQARYKEFITTWKIDEFRRLQQLSKGQKRLAEIALILSINPEVLILDEPFDGLDAVMRIKIQKLLRNIQVTRNTTILYATHILTELPFVADRMIVMRLGRIVYDQKISSDNNSPDSIFKELYQEELCSQ